MKRLASELILGNLRHVLGGIGYILVSKGVMTQGTVEEVTGLILAVVAHVWSSKRKIDRNVNNNK